MKFLAIACFFTVLAGVAFSLTLPAPKKKIEFKNGQSYANCGRVPAACERSGKDAVRGCHPWHAKVTRSGRKSTCDGTLISKRAIITRAQCLFNVLDLFSPSDIQVTLGAFNISDPNESTRQTVRAKALIPHPNREDFCIICFENDIGIIILEENALTLNEHVSPICLWDAEFNPRTFANTVGEAAAWDPKGKLVRNALEVVAYDGQCYQKYNNAVKPLTSFCFQHVRTTDTACTIETGAGFVVKKDGRSYLRGLLDIFENEPLIVKGKDRGFCSSVVKNYIAEDLADYMDWIINNVPDVSRK
ncbi:mannan-binding lectin serine protease 1-like [Cloeon dipterum]|uniref:mannan-binding lectin serine protease 1-like n=1 Tax=Cloeon dipterum TaxID=197152 RepID=UPI0032203690